MQDFYTLEVDGYNGGFGGNALGNDHNGMKFSTRDRENDIHDDLHCAQYYTSAWWFSDCGSVNYNYNSDNAPDFSGVVYGDWRGVRYSLPNAQFCIRPKYKVESVPV